MKKVVIHMLLLLTTSSYLHTQCKDMQPEKAFTELTNVGFFAKKEPRATMLKKLSLRILKAVEGYINDVVTITTKYANSYKSAASKKTFSEKDSAGRPETIAQTKEFKSFINQLGRLSENIKVTINEKMQPLLGKKINIADTTQLDKASLYIRQQYDERQKKALAQLELSLPELQAADDLTLQMQLIKQYVDTAINYFLKSSIEDHYESVIDALKKLKGSIDFPEKLNLDTLKSYYGVSTTKKTKRIKIKNQVKQKLKKYKPEK